MILNLGLGKVIKLHKDVKFSDTISSIGKCNRYNNISSFHLKVGCQICTIIVYVFYHYHLSASKNHKTKFKTSSLIDHT